MFTYMQFKLNRQDVRTGMAIGERERESYSVSDDQSNMAKQGKVINSDTAPSPLVIFQPLLNRIIIHIPCIHN